MGGQRGQKCLGRFYQDLTCITCFREGFVISSLGVVTLNLGVVIFNLACGYIKLGLWLY